MAILNTVRQERRRFLKTWLDDVRFCNWLVYTQISVGGGLCKICVLMQARLKHGTLENAAFVKRPCTDFQKFIEKAVAHQNTNHHNQAVSEAKSFVESMETGGNVCTSLSTAYCKQKKENREIINSIVKTVVLCATNNIPLRGHYVEKSNFMQLLQFRIDAGDETLEKHFSSMAGNAKHTSPSFQNEILAIAGSMLVQEIVAEANETFFLTHCRRTM